MNENTLTELLISLANQPILFFLLIVVTTFILEDLAITVSAIIASQSEIMLFLPLSALFIGIALGDIGLYGIGKYSRRFGFLKRFIKKEGIQKAKKAIDRNLIIAIFTSRFIPGMRLPTYMAIGLFDISFKKFFTTVLVAVGLWSCGVFYLFYTFGTIAEDMLGHYKWYGLGAIILIFLVFSKNSTRIIKWWRE
ncbi:MAG: VTT domain-containing protein [Pseudomonadota bacterium]